MEQVIKLTLITVMIYASVCDFKTKIIPNRVHFLIILLSIINLNLNIGAMVLLPLPFLIITLIKKGSIGGGDIKYIGACSLYLGFYDGLKGLFLGLLIAIIVNLMLRNKTFPLIPYLSIGYLMVL